MNLKVKKRIYLVNRDFQLRYTGAAMVVGAFSSILTIVVILFPLYQFEILRIPRFLPTPILASMLLAVLVNVIFVGMITVMVTHRIAGPMYGLLRYIRRIQTGKYQAYAKTRDGDELGFIFRNFNDMVSSLIRSARKDIHFLKEIRDELEGDSDSLDYAKIGKKIDEYMLSVESRIQKDDG